VVEKDGELHFTQTLWSKTAFPVGASRELIDAEWRRVVAVREEAQTLKSLAQIRALRHFSSPAEAQKVIGNATRHQYQIWRESASTLFDGLNSDGGKK
jgi:hypothetical protein